MCSTSPPKGWNGRDWVSSLSARRKPSPRSMMSLCSSPPAPAPPPAASMSWAGAEVELATREFVLPVAAFGRRDTKPGRAAGAGVVVVGDAKKNDDDDDDDDAPPTPPPTSPRTPPVLKRDRPLLPPPPSRTPSSGEGDDGEDDDDVLPLPFLPPNDADVTTWGAPLTLLFLAPPPLPPPPPPVRDGRPHVSAPRGIHTACGTNDDADAIAFGWSWRTPQAATTPCGKKRDAGEEMEEGDRSLFDVR